MQVEFVINPDGGGTMTLQFTEPELEYIRQLADAKNDWGWSVVFKGPIPENRGAIQQAILGLVGKRDDSKPFS